MKINFVRNAGNGTYLSCFDEIESSLIQVLGNDVKVIVSRKSVLKNITIRILTLISRIHVSLPAFGSKVSFSILMGPSFETMLPYVLGFSKNYVYMYDAWPRFHKEIDQMCTLLNIKRIFYSSKQATQLFNESGSKIKAHWIPEAIKIDEYRFNSYPTKNIDVLEFGRKYQNYHEQIVGILKNNYYTHLYEINSGEVVFKSHKDFVNGLAKSKISICIPSNITHPERSEGISSMTLRYLQSMASKCLIVGVMPHDMKELFDYLPIIEIDKDNPGKQLVEILRNFDKYIPLIERNYMEVAKNHCWQNRVNEIIEFVDNDV